MYIAKVVSSAIIYLHFKTVVDVSFVNCEILLANFEGNTHLHVLAINHCDAAHEIVDHIFKHRSMIFFLYSILIYFLPLGNNKKFMFLFKKYVPSMCILPVDLPIFMSMLSGIFDCAAATSSK